MFIFRWNFVIHGGIDGFSRLIPYMRVATDNTANTALSVFLGSLREFGVPGKIRIDGGSEFSHIKRLMIHLNGDRRGSAIVGESVRNQRIERLWRDVFAKILDKYYKLFYYMEDNGILCLGDDIHLYCLHFVFTRRIQRDLNDWVRAHNCHRIRTERYMTPLQLWYTGSIMNAAETNTAMNNLFRRDIDEVEGAITDFFCYC